MINENDIKEWYNERHRTLKENAWRPYEAYPIFLDYLNVKSGNKLLDVGCGVGYLLKAAEQRGLQTYGVDISEEAIKITKNISKNSIASVDKGEYLKFENETFNYVTCIGALEHFLDMYKALQEIKRVSKKDATILIVVPNMDNFFWKKNDNPGTEQKDINENLFSLKEWKEIFYQAGFKILDIHQDKWFMKCIHPFSSINPYKILKDIVKKVVWIFLPLDKTYQFIFVMNKK